MNSVENYVARRLAAESMEVDALIEQYKKYGYVSSHDITYLRVRIHELKMLCQHGLGDEKLIEISKKCYKKIVELDEKK